MWGARTDAKEQDYDKRGAAVRCEIGGGIKEMGVEEE